MNPNELIEASRNTLAFLSLLGDCSSFLIVLEGSNDPLKVNELIVFLRDVRCVRCTGEVGEDIG